LQVNARSPLTSDSKANQVITRSSSYARRHTALNASKEPDKGRDLYVPELIFGGISPEEKAANALVNLFTFVSIRIVLEQMSGTRHRSPVYTKITKYLEECPLTDSGAWIEGLLKSEEMDLKLAALRIIETREAYVETYFSFANMKNHAVNSVNEQTKKLKSDYLTMTLNLPSVGESEASDGGSGDMST